MLWDLGLWGLGSQGLRGLGFAFLGIGVRGVQGFKQVCKVKVIVEGISDVFATLTPNRNHVRSCPPTFK